METNDERLLRTYASQVEFYAKRWSRALPSGLDLDDLRQVGNMALIDAAQRFDPSREAKFRTYAGYRVNGAMGDEIRRMRWISRHMGIENLMKLIDVRRLQGLPITTEALAEVTGQTVDRIRIWEEQIARGRREARSLTDIVGDGELTPLQIADESPDVIKRIEVREQYRILHTAVDQLPDRLRLVISLHYFEELTMQKIAIMLDLTESRISQLISRAERMLKQRLLSAELRPAQPNMAVCRQCRSLFIRGPVPREFCGADCKAASQNA